VADARKSKLRELANKIRAYGLSQKAAIEKEADWLRKVRDSSGLGVSEAVVNAGATKDLAAEVDTFLAGS
jgi:hypothetical protein